MGDRKRPFVTGDFSMGRLPHFLLVEDDDAHAQLIMMEFDGSHVEHTLERVVDGLEALAYVNNEAPYTDCPRPDVILIDLKLPRADGHEVIRRVKNDERLKAIPIVVLTSSASEADKKRAYASHVNSYLVKPVDFSQLSSMIRDLSIYWGAWNQGPRCVS